MRPLMLCAAIALCGCEDLDGDYQQCVSAGRCGGSAPDGSIDAGPTIDLDAGLVAYWRFDEGAGASTADSAGTDPGTLKGSPAPAWTMGHEGTGLAFDGGGSAQVDFGNPQNLQLEASLTVSAWIFLAAQPANDLPVVSKRSFLDRGWQLYVSDMTATFDVATSMNDYVSITGSTQLPTGSWHQIAGVYDSTHATLAIYIDGALSASTDAGVPARQYNSAQNVHVGDSANCTTTCAEVFDGVIDELRVYNRALDTSEVHAIP